MQSFANLLLGYVRFCLIRGESVFSKDVLYSVDEERPVGVPSQFLV